MTTVCGFCAELSDTDTSNNLMKTEIAPALSIDSRIMYETENYVVIPTIGCFVKGYVLIVSKQHYDCAGKMSKSSIMELCHLTLKVIAAIKKSYGVDSIVFEHGAVSCANRFGGCINHAHIHIVPCMESVLGELEKRPVRLQMLSSLTDIAQKANRGEPYLFFRDVDDKKYFVESDIMISQFFRQLLAKKHGVSNKWDWRQNFFLDNMRLTMYTLKIA